MISAGIDFVAEPRRCDPVGWLTAQAHIQVSANRTVEIRRNGDLVSRALPGAGFEAVLTDLLAGAR